MRAKNLELLLEWAVMEVPEFIQRGSETKRGRALITVVATLGMLQLYSLANRTFEHKIDFLLPIDHLIPFMPWTVFVYQSLYIMVLVGGIICPPRHFIRIMGALILAECIAFCLFAIFTSHYPRPNPADMDSSFWQAVYQFLHASDNPGNTFPSLHATFAYLIGWRMRIVTGSWLWVMWGFVISLTTMTTKQHYIVDVLAAVPFAYFINRVVFGSLDRESKQAP